MKPQYQNSHKCLACGSYSLRPISKPSWMEAVTSDCKPWHRLGFFLVCSECGHLQKQIDKNWQTDIKHIYDEYDIYALSDGIEQVVFQKGENSQRSQLLLKRLMEIINFPEGGRLLDFGCGNGALLKIFKKNLPHWQLAGFELNDRTRTEVESIAGENSFYSGVLDNVEGKFDVITLFHVIEHLTEPAALLKKLQKQLKCEGVLIIQTVNIRQNPFDLMIVDHCSHFSKETLVGISLLAGYEIVEISDDLIQKELTLILRSIEDGLHKIEDSITPPNLAKTANRSFEWLEHIVKHAREFTQEENFGIFGTAIAGTWLAGALGSCVDFFVDEDPLRENKFHMGLPVLKPGDVLKGSYVYLAFPPAIAKKVGLRLGRTFGPINFIIPPDSGSNGSIVAEY